MQPDQAPAVLLATAIWAIFSIAIVFSSPPPPGDQVWRPARYVDGVGLAGLPSLPTRR